MSLIQKRWFKALLGLVMFVTCWLVALDSYRLTASFVFLALVVTYIHFLWTSKTKWMRLMFVAFLVVSLVPIDITLRNYPGPPRFVPLIMGTLRNAAVALEERGEAVLGGCISRGNEPTWVLVW